MRRLLSAAATALLLLAQAPVLAEGSADDIGVMNVSLKDTIKPRFGFKGRRKAQVLPTRLVLVASCPSQWAITAFSMPM